MFVVSCAGKTLVRRANRRSRDVLSLQSRVCSRGTGAHTEHARIEPRFGYRFSKVCVDSEPRAVESANTANSSAAGAANACSSGQTGMAPQSKWANRYKELCHARSRSKSTLMPACRQYIDDRPRTFAGTLGGASGLMAPKIETYLAAQKAPKVRFASSRVRTYNNGPRCAVVVIEQSNLPHHEPAGKIPERPVRADQFVVRI